VLPVDDYVVSVSLQPPRASRVVLSLPATLTEATLLARVPEAPVCLDARPCGRDVKVDEIRPELLLRHKLNRPCAESRFKHPLNGGSAGYFSGALDGLLDRGRSLHSPIRNLRRVAAPKRLSRVRDLSARLSGVPSPRLSSGACSADLRAPLRRHLGPFAAHRVALSGSRDGGYRFPLLRGRYLGLRFGRVVFTGHPRGSVFRLSLSDGHGRARCLCALGDSLFGFDRMSLADMRLGNLGPGFGALPPALKASRNQSLVGL
jgi:hypothetical protein